LKEIVFATGNKGKLKEVKHIFNNTNVKILSLYDLGEVPDIIEDGETFEDNAFIKAKAIWDIYKLPTIADDSGLSIEQLNSQPGVISARYAGEDCTFDDNNKKVLEELSRFKEPHLAKFVCCAVYIDVKNKFTAVGEFHGKIIKEFRGQNGFGYDPIFLPAGFNKTLAELTTEEKNRISHRARAFNKLKEILSAEELI